MNRKNDDTELIGGVDGKGNLGVESPYSANFLDCVQQSQSGFDEAISRIGIPGVGKGKYSISLTNLSRPPISEILKIAGLEDNMGIATILRAVGDDRKLEIKIFLVLLEILRMQLRGDQAYDYLQSKIKDYNK